MPLQVCGMESTKEVGEFEKKSMQVLEKAPAKASLQKENPIPNCQKTKYG